MRRRKTRARVPEQKIAQYASDLHLNRRDSPLGVASNARPALRVAGLFLFDWHTDHIPPLGPRSVVVPNLFEPEQFGQYKPSVTGALADSAVNDRVVVRLVAKIILINPFEFLTAFESAVVISRRFPRNALCPGNMAAADHALLRILSHMRYLAFEFAGRTHIN